MANTYRIGTACHVFKTFLNHCLCKDSCCCCTVTCIVVCLRGNLLNQLSTHVFERASQFELLAKNPETFMWVSPVPQELLDRYGLIQRSCEQNGRVYKDVMIHRRDYTLSELDELFVSELVKAKRRVIAAE